MNRDELNKIAHISAGDFGIAGEPPQKISGREGLRTWLAGEIAHLLINDFNKLVNALYRIDISEHEAKNAFAGDDVEKISKKLADLIIEREYQKVITRKKYKGG